jgi:TRAP-type C4-dicarboxylate transport system permease small subunit
VTVLRRLIVPLCAALAAALFAHVGIDVAGDYLLPHDTYDDVSHASRYVVLAAVAMLLFAMFVAALSAAIREARGSVDAFGRILRSSLGMGPLPFFVTTLAFAALTLVAMEYADANAAGQAVDDLGDLLGGSLALGLAMLGIATIACATLARRLVELVAGLRRTLVHSLAIAFAALPARSVATRVMCPRGARTFAASRVFGTTISGRAPPLRA